MRDSISGGEDTKSRSFGIIKVKGGTGSKIEGAELEN